MFKVKVSHIRTRLRFSPEKDFELFVTEKISTYVTIKSSAILKLPHAHKNIKMRHKGQSQPFLN